eukprot:7123565-Alexandrium_andersonii.AAC.1
MPMIRNDHMTAKTPRVALQVARAWNPACHRESQGNPPDDSKRRARDATETEMQQLSLIHISEPTRLALI